jgi:hypothetical protein
MKILRVFWTVLYLVSLTLLSSCGGGGGGGQTSSTLVSGVAATGAPISGTVTLKDKNGLLRGPTATDLDGNFSFDVTGLVPPFILKAEWTSDAQTHTLFSVALGTGTVHINPLSNLALLLAAAADPPSVFGAQNAAPDTTGISETKLRAAVAQIKAMLTPLLDDYGITDFDPLTGNYTATPDNKLDAMLDVISFTATAANGSLTIKNKLDGTIIATGSVTNLAGIILDKSKSPDKAVLTDIREITERIGVLCFVMNMGASLTTADIEDLFIPDPNYGASSGLTRAQDVASIVTIFGAGGSNTNGRLKGIRNVRLVSDQTANYSGRSVTKVYLLNYDFIFENGVVVHGNNVTFGRETSSGLWKFIGDPVNSTVGNNYGCFWLGSISGNNYGCSGTLVSNNYGGVIDMASNSIPPIGISWGNPFVQTDTTSDLWKVVRNGNIVEISYKYQDVFVKYAEFNLDNGSLRLRYSAVSAWSPQAILSPSFQGDNIDPLGTQIEGNWYAGNEFLMLYTWVNGSKWGIGSIRISPPVNDEVSASIQIEALADPADVSKILLLTIFSEPFLPDLPGNRSVSIDASTIQIPESGWFIQPPMSGRVLTLNNWTTGSALAAPTVTASFDRNMAISGQVVANAESQKSIIRLYMESDQYYSSIGVAGGSYTLTVKP